jgi:hypothetical protein
MQRAIARMRIKLRMFPTPRYVRKRKKVVATVATIPLRLLAKINEKVKRRQKKTRIKKSGTTPKEAGSIK